MEAFYDLDITKLTTRISELRFTFDFPEGSTEGILVKAIINSEKVKALKKETSDLEKALHELTKTTIENLSDDEARFLLFEKWVRPIYEDLLSILLSIVSRISFCSAREHFSNSSFVIFSFSSH